MLVYILIKSHLHDGFDDFNSPQVTSRFIYYIFFQWRSGKDQIKKNGLNGDIDTLARLFNLEH